MPVHTAPLTYLPTYPLLFDAYMRSVSYEEEKEKEKGKGKGKEGKKEEEKEGKEEKEEKESYVNTSIGNTVGSKSKAEKQQRSPPGELLLSSWHPLGLSPSLSSPLSYKH